jgi:hypothetical protein
MRNTANQKSVLSRRAGARRTLLTTILVLASALASILAIAPQAHA